MAFGGNCIFELTMTLVSFEFRKQKVKAGNTVYVASATVLQEAVPF